MLDWIGPDGHGSYRATFNGHALVAYRTPGAWKGWSVEIDGDPGWGFIGCGKGAPNDFDGVRSMLEAEVRGRLGSR